MHRLLRVVIMAIFFGLLASGWSSATAAASKTVLTGQSSIDPATCRGLKSDLVGAMRTPAGRARADAASVRQILGLRPEVGSDCVIKRYEVRPGAATADASYLQGYWKYMTFYIGQYNAGTIHVDVGMVITGSIATTRGGWGPSCYFQWNLPAIFGGGITWCGVWNDGNWYTEPGTNYYVWVWPNTWFTRSGYMRYCVEGQGVSCRPWGSLG